MHSRIPFSPSKLPILVIILILTGSLFASLTAHALPAYARQTGQNCVACHAGGQFPELTPYGRMFKLTGYTIGARGIPISVMGIASVSKTTTPTSDPSFAKEGNAIFQTGSIFLAGKITENIGTFIQTTYNNYDSQGASGQWQGKWGSDNVDVRFADRIIDQKSDLIYGLSLNNNPSVADPWNSAPAWIQYVPTKFGVTAPDASPMVGQLGAQIAGLSAYTLWNKTLYAEVSGYQTANRAWSFLSQGTANADQVKLQGTAPYLRLALTHEWGPHNAMLGMFAMNVKVYPDNLNATGPTTDYRDRGVDAQYQYLLDPHTVTVQASYIKESISNGDITGTASNAFNTLQQLRMKASYIYQAKYGASLSYFSTTGTTDSTLYPDMATNPDTRGWAPELFWIPRQNVRVGMQYYAFQRYHGATSNYDGAGRDASDNNTMFFYVWGAY